MRSTLLMMMLVLAGALAASQAAANVFAADGRDPRRVQSRSGQAHAFAAIGIVRNNQPIAMLDDDERLLYARGEATAFLVSPCYAVTNYHAVFGEDSGPTERDSDHSVTFSVGDRAGDRGFKVWVRGVPVFWGDFREDQQGEDWAVLRLDRCVGADAEIGWLDLAPRPVAALSHASLSIAGYPGDKDQGVLWRADDCRVTARPREPGLWSSDCAASPGASGSPVFLSQNGALKIVGIMEGAENDRPEVQRRYAPRLANLVVDVSGILRRDDVRTAIDADIRSLGR
ncbi:MAG TPA: serine protease [Caulobacteraceae bacterium]